MSYTNKGFTLIEIGIVLFVVGILVVMFLPHFTQGMRDKATAKLLIRSSQKYFDGVKAIADSCNIAVDSVVNSSGNTALTAPVNPYFTEVMERTSILKTQYKYCYSQASVVWSGYNFDRVYLGILNLQGHGRQKISIRPVKNGYQIADISYDLAIEIIKQLNANPDDYPFVERTTYPVTSRFSMSIYSYEISYVTIYDL